MSHVTSETYVLWHSIN